MNKGKYVFRQVMEYFPRWVFDASVEKYKGDYRMRMSCFTQCQHLLFGQLAGCKSLNEIELILKTHSKALYHLGFECTVDSSSLSRANETRDYRIYEELGQWLIRKVRPMYAKEQVTDLYLPGWEILAIDSTTISCSIKLAEWALGKYSKGGVKMHTVLDLRGSIPDSIYITDSRYHDSNVLDVYEPYKWAIYTMDKAYVDFEALWAWTQKDVYFVTRPKSTMKYETVEVNYNINELVGIVGDETIRLTGYKTSKLYPGNLRLTRYYDVENDEVISFITNNFDLGPLEIAKIYRNRWEIETFVKWIKGNLTIKSLWGYSENAVKTHLWIAISAYLMLAWIKASLRSPLSITQVATIVEKTILTKDNLREMLVPEPPLTENQNDKELSLFE